MQNITLIFIGIVVIIIIIPILWTYFYTKYIKNAKSFYNKCIIDLDDINKDSSVEKRLLKLYWNRQQTYEFSGYAILLIAIVFLMGCIAIFIFSYQIVTIPGIKISESDYVISLLSLRIGISLIVFFVCQILLKLYRYCLKFAVFYIGMFDALIIYKEIEVNLKEAIDMFMPDTDIGPTPQGPMKEMAELFAIWQKNKSKFS